MEVYERELKEPMRHESIEITLRRNVETNTERTADASWIAFQKSVSDTAHAPVVQNGVSGACASQIVEQQAPEAPKPLRARSSGG